MRRIAPSLLFLPLALVAAAPRAQEPVDEAAVEFLRTQGLEHSQVMEHLSWICDVHGPRLTGSPNLRRAQDWAVKTFTSWGLQNAHLEEWGPFGRGWQLDHFSIGVVGENPWPVLAWPKAWSPPVEGRIEAEVIDVSGMTADEVGAIDLRDKIVMVQTPRAVSEPFEGLAKRHDAERLLAMADGATTSRTPRRAPSPREASATAATADRSEASRRATEFAASFRRSRAVRDLVMSKYPVAILDRGSKGDYGTIFVSRASVYAPPGTPREERPSAQNPRGQRMTPQITLAVEHYNRIGRMLTKGVPVRMALELRATYFDDDPMERNVIAEIPGTDPAIADEIVMIGAHFDSWHSGTGSTDNGCGSAVMMEAMRLLSSWVETRGQGPRRTIRVGLWSGEEQGLIGSRNHVEKHYAVRGGRGEPPQEIKPLHDKLSGYYNLDNGTGRLRGVYLQGNEAVAPIFRAWLRPFHDLDAHTLTLSNTGGTDHQSFDRVGLPGFQFIQDPVAYSPRTHHSNMDNWDHAIAEDLQQAATIIASFAWHTAQRDEKLPRKPMGQ